MKIAVVGSGISGLVTAYRLGSKHQVTLYEANDYLGGHTNTVSVNTADGPLAIDTGFIVFNDRTYPHFVQLLDELGVESTKTSMSFSVCDERSGLEYNGSSLRTLFAQKRNLARPRFLRMLRDIYRFNCLAREYAAQADHITTVGQFLLRHDLGSDFAECYLLPMGSAIWSCPMGRFTEFPIGFICEFFLNHGLLDLRDRPQWRVIKGGSAQYVKAIVHRFRARIRLRTPVVKVQRAAESVSVSSQFGDREEFDHVVFACHSDQALRILGENATQAEREVLSAFPYERNTAVLHTDKSLLPSRRIAWASWNYRVRDGHCERPASVTYNMNILQGIKAPKTYCVTLNDDRIDPAHRIREFVYEHPVYSVKRWSAQSRHPELINHRRVSYCGAYWRNGFHEDGVVSALQVVRAIDAWVGAQVVQRRPELVL